MAFWEETPPFTTRMESEPKAAVASPLTVPTRSLALLPRVTGWPRASSDSPEPALTPPLSGIATVAAAPPERVMAPFSVSEFFMLSSPPVISTELFSPTVRLSAFTVPPEILILPAGVLSDVSVFFVFPSIPMYSISGTLTRLAFARLSVPPLTEMSFLTSQSLVTFMVPSWTAT